MPTNIKKLEELYIRYDKYMNKGQFGMAEATLYRIRSLECLVGKESKPTAEEQMGINITELSMREE